MFKSGEEAPSKLSRTELNSSTPDLRNSNSPEISEYTPILTKIEKVETNERESVAQQSIDSRSPG